MITKYTHGNPINTGAMLLELGARDVGSFPFDSSFDGNKFTFSFKMEKNDILYGLGEAPRGINKRGWVYESYCSDDPFHTETKRSLYAAHNFIMLGGTDRCSGIFVDFRARIIWDIGYT